MKLLKCQQQYKTELSMNNKIKSQRLRSRYQIKKANYENYTIINE